jgi:hypothetical protein
LIEEKADVVYAQVSKEARTMFQRAVMLAGAAVLVLCLSGCKREPKSVAYYREHEAERKALIQKYANEAGAERKDPDLFNAWQAEVIEYDLKRKAEDERLRTLPPPLPGGPYPGMEVTEQQRRETQRVQQQTMGSEGVRRQIERERGYRH